MKQKQRTFNSDLLGEVVLSEMPNGNAEVLKKDTSGVEEEVRHPHWVCDLDCGIDAPDSVIENEISEKTMEKDPAPGRRRIYILVIFQKNVNGFASSVHYSLKDAREAQMYWMRERAEYYGLDVPTMDELYEGTDETFYYNEDTETLIIDIIPDAEYSTIEIKDIKI